MIAWARRHLPEAFLVPAGIAAGTVSLLSDVEEWYGLGEETGIIVSQVSFAYVGAYLFNLLIVERPKRKALEGYYEAARGSLLSLALNPAHMVNMLSFHADVDSRPQYGATLEQLEDIISKIDWAKMPKADARILFKGLLSGHEKAYERVVGLLNQFEPAVSVSIAEMHAEQISGLLSALASFPETLKGWPMRSEFAQVLFSYQQAGQRLGRALLESRRMPEIEPYFLPRLRYDGLDATQAPNAIEHLPPSD